MSNNVLKEWPSDCADGSQLVLMQNQTHPWEGFLGPLIVHVPQHLVYRIDFYEIRQMILCYFGTVAKSLLFIVLGQQTQARRALLFISWIPGESEPVCFVCCAGRTDGKEATRGIGTEPWPMAERKEVYFPPCWRWHNSPGDLDSSIPSPVLSGHRVWEGFRAGEWTGQPEPQWCKFLRVM